MSGAPVMAGAGILLPLGFDYANSRGTAVVGSGSGNSTYGSYVELSSALPYDTSAIQINLAGGFSGALAYLRLAIGAAGSEVIIANDIPWRGHTPGDVVVLPLALPKGARLAIGVRYAFSGTIYASAVLTPAHPWLPHGYRFARGFDWVALNAGATAHTLSAYGNFTTDLPAGIKALMWGMAVESADTTSSVLGELEHDGVQIAAATMAWSGFVPTTTRWTMVPGAFRAGVTVRARHQCSSTATASGRTMNHALIALG